VVVDPLSSPSEALSRLPADQRLQLRSFSPAGGCACFRPTQPQAPLLLDLASNDLPGLSAHPGDYGRRPTAAIDAQGIRGRSRHA